jgi:hypothetical protein
MTPVVISIIIFFIGMRLGWAWCKSYYMVAATSRVLEILSKVMSNQMTHEEAKEAFKELEDL